MSTHITHYPFDTTAIRADAFATANGRTIAFVRFDGGLEVVCVSDDPSRMDPQVFTRRLRELADEIDRKCDAIRDEQAHVGGQ